jgi:hypothetical protein
METMFSGGRKLISIADPQKSFQDVSQSQDFNLTCIFFARIVSGGQRGGMEAECLPKPGCGAQCMEAEAD